MPDTDTTITAIERAQSWNARVGLIRRVPEDYGLAQPREVYSSIAERVYVPHLAPDFAYVHHRPEYDLEGVAASLDNARQATGDFAATTPADLETALDQHRTPCWPFA